MGRDEITLKSLNIKTQKKQWEIRPKIKVSSNLDFSYTRRDTGDTKWYTKIILIYIPFDLARAHKVFSPLFTLGALFLGKMSR